MSYTDKILFFFSFLFLHCEETIEEYKKKLENAEKEIATLQTEITLLIAKVDNERVKNISIDQSYKHSLEITNQSHQSILRQKNIEIDRILKQKNEEVNQLKKKGVGAKAAPYICYLAAIAVTFVIMKIYHTLYYDTNDNSKNKNALKV